MNTNLQKLLEAPFPPEDIEWRPLTVSHKTGKGLAAAYITARAAQRRLDEVFGPDGWSVEYQELRSGGFLCRITFTVKDENGNTRYAYREDGAEMTAIEAIKGGISSAFKRAASALGIGRYLYDLPQQWVLMDGDRFASTPSIPKQFLPQK